MKNCKELHNEDRVLLLIDDEWQVVTYFEKGHRVTLVVKPVQCISFDEIKEMKEQSGVVVEGSVEYVQTIPATGFYFEDYDTEIGTYVYRKVHKCYTKYTSFPDVVVDESDESANIELN